MITRVVVRELLMSVDLTDKTDVIKECKTARIEQDHENIEKLSTSFESCLNPFTITNPNTHLYCITGKPPAEDVPDLVN